MKAQDVAVAIAKFTPRERERLGEEILVQLSPIQIAEILVGLARVGQDSSFNHTGKSGFIGDIIGDVARKLMAEGMFSEEEMQCQLF